MMPRCTPELLEFVRQQAPGKASSELAQLVNEKFGTTHTQKTMSRFMKNHKIRNGLRRSPAAHTERYPRCVREYIRDNHKGVGPKKMAQLLNERFGTDYTRYNIKAFYANNGLSSGLKGSEGQSPPNKGKKGFCYPGCEKTWFQKGNVPHTWVPVGTVQKKGDGYLWKKIADVPNAGRHNWRQLHILVWEEANGPLPEGGKILFKDGNPENVELSNLVLSDASEIACLNGLHLRSSDPQITETGILIAKVSLAASKRLKNEGGNKCSKTLK